MRISDWSSDLCSSDLLVTEAHEDGRETDRRIGEFRQKLVAVQFARLARELFEKFLPARAHRECTVRDAAQRALVSRWRNDLVRHVEQHADLVAIDIVNHNQLCSSRFHRQTDRKSTRLNSSH